VHRNPTGTMVHRACNPVSASLGRCPPDQCHCRPPYIYSRFRQKSPFSFKGLLHVITTNRAEVHYNSRCVTNSREGVSG
jgi:hypothetical protein